MVDCSLLLGSSTLSSGLVEALLVVGSMWKV